MKNKFVYGTLDIETSLIEEGVQKLVVGATYDGKTTRFFTDSKKLIQDIFQSKIKYWYAHNLSYDIRFLITELNNMGFSLEFTCSGSNVIRIFVRMRGKTVFEFRDSVCILKSSLAVVSEYLCQRNKKKKFCFSKEVIDSEELRDYLSYDVLSLHEALKKYMILNDVKRLGLTGTSMGYRDYDARYGKKYKLGCYISYDYRIRQAYYGGRTEVFQVRTGYEKDIYYYDFNSLYPSCMMEEFPYGKLKRFDSSMKDHYPFYIAECIITVPNLEQIPLLPYRHIFPKKKENKLIFPAGKIKGWYNSIEIEEAIELGYDVQKLKIYVFEKSDYIFNEWITENYKKRLFAKENNDKALEYIQKIKMNSLYGYFAKKEVDNNAMLVSDSYIDEFLAKNNMKEDVSGCRCGNSYLCFIPEKRKKYSTTAFLSSFITSYARKKMHRTMNEINNSEEILYYCDTDSIITTKKLSTSNKLGELKLEDKIDEGIFPLSKIYGYGNAKKEIVKIKGFSNNEITMDNLDSFVNGEISIKDRDIHVMKLRTALKKNIREKNKDFDSIMKSCYDLEKEIFFGEQNYKRVYDFSDEMIKTTPIIL